MPVTTQNLSDVIKYQKPSDAQVEAISDVRGVAEDMIYTILRVCPSCADQQAAIRHVREALMTANAAIVLDGIV